MRHYKSVVAQSLHFFGRPHLCFPDRALAGPAAWYGRELKSSEHWAITLCKSQQQELIRAVEFAMVQKSPMRELSVEDFPLTGLAHAISLWRRELSSGRGFILVRGLPVQELSPLQCEFLFWGLGLHLGVPGAQNSQGDLLGHVRDEKPSAETVDRLYKSSKAIAYHCDAADAVGLLCLRTAREGGLSRIVSSVTVFNEFLKRHPESVPRLFSPVYMDARGENGLDYFSVPPLRFDGQTLRTFYHSDYFRSAARYSAIKSRVESFLAILDQYEAIALDPELYLEMELKPGDAQFISNHTVIHARTEYKDSDLEDGGRHLLRLWLSLPEREKPFLALLRQKEKLKLFWELARSKVRSKLSSSS